MIINALNSGANVFMADFEDANSPTWDNLSRARSTCATRCAGTIELHRSASGKSVRARATSRDADRAPARLAPRRRSTSRVDGAPIAGSLFDFGLFFFHNAQALLERGTGPYFYLPKMREPPRSPALERRVRAAPRTTLGIPRGTIKATVLIETLPRRSRWTRSSTSCASTRRASTAAAGTTSSASSRSCANDPDRVLPDRAQVTMDTAVHARLHAAADQDLPPPRRARDGRHGGADPDQGRPGGQRRGARARCAPTSCAR